MDTLEEFIFSHFNTFISEEVKKEIQTQVLKSLLKPIPDSYKDFPTNEVIAYNQEGEVHFGYIHLYKGKVECESVDASIDGVTHYLEIPDISKLFEK